MSDMSDNDSGQPMFARLHQPLTIQMQIQLAMACLALLITIGVSVTLYLMQRHTLIDGIDKRLMTAAVMASATVPSDYHDRITGPGSVTDAQYQAIVERYNQLCRSLEMEYLWSLMVIDGKIVFTTATSPDKIASNRKHAQFFEPHSNPELYAAAFAKMAPTYQINDDKWGRIRVALIPQRDRQGRPCLFGASVHLTDVDRQMSQLVYHCLAGSLILFLGSVLLSRVLARSVARSIQREIAEREQAEAALRESEAVYHALFENSLDGILLTVPASDILAANPAACAMLGRTEEEICRGGRAVVIDEADPRFPGMKEERARTGKVFCEMTCLRKNGARFPIELMSVVLPGGAKSFVIIRDITARKQAEEALRESEARLHAAIESIPFDFWFMDATGHYVMQNSISIGIWGRQVGHSLKKAALPPETLALWRENNRRAFAGEVVTGEFEYQHGNERVVYYGIIGPVRSEERIIGIVGVNIDVTARKQAEGALREADRRKDEFLAMLAHELRNPLAPIRNAVQLLRRTDLEPSILPRQHDIIERQVTHMARLLDDLLDVSRITHGKIELKKQPLTLATVVAHAVETAMPLIQTRRHTLEFTPPPDTLRVEADLDRLAQALGNLLSNAAKYTDAGGRIWLEAEREDGAVVLRVRDSGLGIAPEVLPHIFDLFTQAERSLDRAQGGLGIGLTLARNLVQLHGGTLEARSAGRGQGSEFTLRLPAWTGDWQPGEARPMPSAQSVFIKHRILVVDDVADTAESMVELLESWGYRACAAYDGFSALETARRCRPDVVLLDIGLPGMNGYDVARLLRAEYGPGLLLVALTGYGQERDREQASQAGFDHHMTKPVDLRALGDLLRSLSRPGRGVRGGMALD